MLRTRVVWSGVAGTPYYTNFYWAGDGPSIADSAQDKTIAWATGAVGIITSVLSLQVESEVTEINEANGEIVAAYDVAGSTSVGTAAGEPLPFRTQALTYFGTIGYRRGRRVRGRSFLGGLTEVIQSNGIGPTEDIREAVQGIYSLTLSGPGAVHCVWSRPIPPSEDDPGAAGVLSNVTSYQTRATWSSLRSRGA